MKRYILEALVLSLAIGANAAITIDFANGNTPHASKSVTLSSLNGPLSFSQVGMASSTASGTVSAPVGSSEAIGIVWTAANDWNSTTAVASFGDFSTYAAGLTAVFVQADAGKMGVKSGAVSDNRINANDVIVMTVDTSTLTSGTLQIEAMGLTNLDEGNIADYVVYDASADSVVFSSFSTTSDSLPFVFQLDDGDQVYVAGSTGMTGDGFRMSDMYTLDVTSTNPPPPPDTWLKRVDLQLTGGDTETGYNGISAGDDVSAIAVETYTNPPSVTDITVTLSVDDNSGLRAFHRNETSNVLLDDWFGVDGRGTGNKTMTVTLSGLAAGEYNWKSYHDDPIATINTLQYSEMSYTMDHAGTQVSGSFFQSKHLGETVDFSFISDGINDVVFSLVADTDMFAVLNGFELRDSGDRYYIWAEANGLTNGVSDDFEADVEVGGGDGLINLLEYAYGGDPLVNDAEEVSPRYGYVAANFIYVHNERTDNDELIYTVVADDNLVFEPGFVTNGVSFVGESGVTDDIKSVTNSVDGTPSEQFMRVFVKLEE